MDIKDLKNKIVYVLKNLRSIIKEILRLPKAKLYIILSVILTLFFIVVTFPYEVLIRNQLQKLESSINSTITVGQIDFGVFGDTFIDNLLLSFKSGSELSFRDVSMDIALNPIALFINNKAKGNIDIKEIKYEKTDLKAEGVLKCDFDLKVDTEKETLSDGFLNLTIQNVKVNGISVMGFNIPPVRLSEISAKSKVKNRALVFENFIFTGPDLKGKINGQINIKKFFWNSRINLSIEIDKDSRMLADYKVILGNLDKDIKIDISGALSNPRPKFNLPKEIPSDIIPTEKSEVKTEGSIKGDKAEKGEKSEKTENIDKADKKNGLGKKSIEDRIKREDVRKGGTHKEEENKPDEEAAPK